MALSRLTVCLSALLLLPCFAWPQIQQQAPVSGTPGTSLTRIIQGLVLDSKGVPVPNAIVLIKDGKTLEVRTYIAGKNGAYHFYGLSTDVSYELRAQSNGFSSAQKTVSVFDSHKVVKLNLKLKKKKPKPEKFR